jgi:hypothetical protein
MNKPFKYLHDKSHWCLSRPQRSLQLMGIPAKKSNYNRSKETKDKDKHMTWKSPRLWHLLLQLHNIISRQFVKFCNVRVASVQSAQRDH